MYTTASTFVFIFLENRVRSQILEQAVFRVLTIFYTFPLSTITKCTQGRSGEYRNLGLVYTFPAQQ